MRILSFNAEIDLQGTNPSYRIQLENFKLDPNGQLASGRNDFTEKHIRLMIERGGSPAIYFLNLYS